MPKLISFVTWEFRRTNSWQLPHLFHDRIDRNLSLPFFSLQVFSAELPIAIFRRFLVATSA
jgi:hypothetical protein